MLLASVYLDLLLTQLEVLFPQRSAVMASLFFCLSLNITSKKPSLSISTFKVSLPSLSHHLVCDVRYMIAVFTIYIDLVYFFTCLLSVSSVRLGFYLSSYLRWYHWYITQRLALRCLINMC
ncbi:hypothetical protein HJG60_010982 [Phyllostomus discolor]|uniref:Uncharacterized protein n=1 Tax=Phyllostomus discolor TaxID=89673 RepID=A0A834ACB8_9CHIR|nr:hypothetical protein HJG60_010982 [Phyllostomus discolor]